MVVLLRLDGTILMFWTRLPQSASITHYHFLYVVSRTILWSSFTAPLMQTTLLVRKRGQILHLTLQQAMKTLTELIWGRAGSRIMRVTYPSGMPICHSLPAQIIMQQTRMRCISFSAPRQRCMQGEHPKRSHFQRWTDQVNLVSVFAAQVHNQGND